MYFCGGEMAEWSIAAVLKTVEVRASGGSNPSLSARTPKVLRNNTLGVFLFLFYPFSYFIITIYPFRYSSFLDVFMNPFADFLNKNFHFDQVKQFKYFYLLLI